MTTTQKTKKTAKLNKWWWVLAAAIVIALWLLLTGCASAPTRAERRLYDVRTNYIDVVNLRTNYVTVTNVVAGEVVVATAAAVTRVTNTVPVYQLEPKESVSTLIDVGSGAAGNWLGLGGVLGTLLATAYGAYARARNARMAKAGEVMAQQIETARELLPPELDAKYRVLLAEQQRQAKVKATVDGFLNAVSTRQAAADAKTIK